MKTMPTKLKSTETGSATHINTMMNSSRVRQVAIGAAMIVAGGAVWYLFRPELLFVNKTVNEELPTVTTAVPDAASSTTPMASTTMASTTPYTSMKPASSDSAQTITLASGMFHKGAHETKGTATIHQLTDGSRLLRLTGFETSNGPDVHVYLVAAGDAMDSDTVKSAGFVDLGSMKGNVGDQNYEIPADVDLSKYRAVTIWCARFGVNFGTAPLK